MTTYYRFNDIKKNLSESTLCTIFGGTFDPIHEGHIRDIRALLEISATLIIAPTTQNPWKERTPTSVEHRIEMISLALTEEKIPHTVSNIILEDGVYILNYPYRYSIELLSYVLKYKKDVLWAIGEDLIHTAQEWKEWSTKGADFIVLPLLNGYSSTEVREKKIKELPSIKKYICDNKLYGD